MKELQGNLKERDDEINLLDLLVQRVDLIITLLEVSLELLHSLLSLLSSVHGLFLLLLHLLHLLADGLHGVGCSFFSLGRHGDCWLVGLVGQRRKREKKGISFYRQEEVGLEEGV